MATESFPWVIGYFLRPLNTKSAIAAGYIDVNENAWGGALVNSAPLPDFLRPVSPLYGDYDD
jgi:hypothetical protein